jgi:hypothetical protein
MHQETSLFINRYQKFILIDDFYLVSGTAFDIHVFRIHTLNMDIIYLLAFICVLFIAPVVA